MVECTGLENQRPLIADRGFESHPHRQILINNIVRGKNTKSIGRCSLDSAGVPLTFPWGRLSKLNFAAIAQQVEQLTCNQ